MKIKIISTLFFLLLSTLALAIKPETCPDVRIIQATGLDAVYPDGIRKDYWIGYARAKTYDTQYTWSLNIAYIYAVNKEEALQTGNEELKKLRYELGPYRVAGNNRVWACSYINKKGPSATVTTTN